MYIYIYSVCVGVGEEWVGFTKLVAGDEVPRV
jgi:hypothetical protein